ncbi:winged helix-turn-helix domain-containing protein [Candidatus Bathyarchaeota archaeon]|nr:MAG: winged helix-turn-helix domain-containing protein [Candidatus Bathyarchaeota archaeon]
MDQHTISKEAARRFLITKQGFHQGKEKTGTLEAIKRLECIQIDPVNVVHRNHHLVLHSRVSDYKPSYLDALLYKDRAVFEYWCNAKSIIPMEEFRYFRYRMQNYMEFHSPFYERLKAKREELKGTISYVLSTIETDGPLCAQDFKREGEVGSKTTKGVLNLLWDCGEVMIHHVEGNRRYYDLAEHILPKDISIEVPNREEYNLFMIRKYMRAYGFVDVRDWRFGWLSLKAPQRKLVVEEMVKDGKIYPVKIEGIKHIYYVLEEYLNALEAIEDSLLEEKIHFIAPLDNLLWNRRMISEVFDFVYVWEIYKIPEKRQFGYYVLPILYGTRFVGRIDPKLDRASKTMIVNSLFLEKERFDDSLVVELAVALKRFLWFHNVSQVKIVKTKPKRLKNTLLVELNQSASDVQGEMVKRI